MVLQPKPGTLLRRSQKGSPTEEGCGAAAGLAPRERAQPSISSLLGSPRRAPLPPLSLLPLLLLLVLAVLAVAVAALLLLLPWGVAGPGPLWLSPEPEAPPCSAASERAAQQGAGAPAPGPAPSLPAGLPRRASGGFLSPWSAEPPCGPCCWDMPLERGGDGGGGWEGI
jgi:hypothetical protein